MDNRPHPDAVARLRAGGDDSRRQRVARAARSTVGRVEPIQSASYGQVTRSRPSDTGAAPCL